MTVRWSCYRLGVRRGLRRLCTLRADSIVVVAAIAVAVGASAIAFSVVDAILLRPLPAREAPRLVFIRDSFEDSKGSMDWGFPSGQRLEALRDRVRAIDALGAVMPRDSAGARIGGRPSSVLVRSVTPDLFAMMGVPFACGTGFASNPHRAVRADTVVISSRLARDWLASPTSACGRTVTLGDSDYLVVGVLASSFRWSYLYEVDAWMPASPGELSRAVGVEAIGRLRRGVTFERAAAEVERAGSTIAREVPSRGQPLRSMFLVEYVEVVVGDTQRITRAVAIIIPLVVLAAIANILVLQLARFVRSSSDVAVREVLGEPWWGPIIETLGESTTYVAAGLVVAVAVGNLAVPLLAEAMPSSFARVGDMSIGAFGTVFSVALAIGLLAVSTVPSACSVLRLSRPQRTTSVGSGARSGIRVSRLISAMNGLQVTAVVVSTTVALLAGLSVWITKSAHLGFEARDVLVYSVAPTGARGGGSGPFAQLAEQVVARVEAVPGVRGAAVATALPLGGGAEAVLKLRATDRADASVVSAGWRAVSPSYFEVLRIPTLAGRILRGGPWTSAGEVIVNRAFASALWPSRTAAGQEVEIVGTFARRILGGDRLRVIGVVGDTLRRGLAPSQPEVFVPLAASPLLQGSLIVRWAGPPQAIKEIDAALSAVEPSRPFKRDEPTRLIRIVDDLLALPRLVAGAMMAISGAAGVLALYGIWSVTVLTATQRIKEAALRQAVGASRHSVAAALVWPQALALGLGALAGTALMYRLGPLVAARFELSLPYEWRVQMVALVIVGAATGIALIWPIRDALSRPVAQILREP